MQFENQPDQIQPQSAPAGLTAAGLLHAVKRREELGQSFFRDGNTRVFNRHRMRIQQNADARALRGIEDGVHQNIVQRVGQEILVSPDCHVRSHVLFNVQPLLRKQLFIQLQLPFHHLAQIDRIRFEDKAAGLDSADDQNLLDEAFHPAGNLKRPC